MVQEQSEAPTTLAHGATEETSPVDAVRAPIGMRDVLWPSSARWEELVGIFSRLARQSGFGLLVTPVVEDVRLFRRAVGEQSEVVGKEMYELTDRGGRQLALRPEGTAPVVRAFLEHHPQVPWKVWYLTPAYRYEKPQAGRYREHHQLGVEALGTDDPDMDVEVIALAQRFYSELGLSRLDLAVNSMGCAEDRAPYVEALRRYLDQRLDQLCDEHHERYTLNPLRVLDCKRPECVEATRAAPMMVDFLDDGCKSHFSRVREGLDALGIAHRLEPRLVRGLDYYTRTTFEFAALALDQAQNAVGGGGRYDGLAEAIGGTRTPGVGFGIGMERLLLACDAEGCFQRPAPSPDVFVVDATGSSAARDIVARLCDAGLAAVRSYDDRPLKAQMRLADRSGARFAVIVGRRELDSDTVSVRDLRRDGDAADRADQADQVVVPRDGLVEFLQDARGDRDVRR